MADSRDTQIPIDRLVATVRKNSREEVRISLRLFRGHRFIDVRLYALNADGTWIFTPKGFGIKQETYQPIMDGLAEAHALAIKEGFFGG